jgi:hypothetical protein
MREYIDNILQGIDIEIDEIDLYSYDIIETSLSMVHKLLEKPLYFDPFRQIGFTTLGRDMIDPLKSW